MNVIIRNLEKNFTTFPYKSYRIIDTHFRTAENFLVYYVSLDISKMYKKKYIYIQYIFLFLFLLCDSYCKESKFTILAVGTINGY